MRWKQCLQIGFPEGLVGWKGYSKYVDDKYYMYAKYQIANKEKIQKSMLWSLKKGFSGVSALSFLWNLFGLWWFVNRTENQNIGSNLLQSHPPPDQGINGAQFILTCKPQSTPCFCT
jgi:hypothetical protein